MTRRIVYMGTPDFACPALHMLVARDDVEVALVVTQPDRPAGRGRQLQASPVKRLAESFGVPVYQPDSLRSAGQRQPIMDLHPDLIVVAAYGLILGRSILELPTHGCVNLHASILPRYRGASPITAAILNGDRETGVTLMRMERGLDTGPMFAVARLEIGARDTTASLTDHLSVLAGEFLIRKIDDVLNDSLEAVSQPRGGSLTRPLVKGDGWIDWARPALDIERQVRAMWAWPRASTSLPDGSTFQIHMASLDEVIDDAQPGTVAADHGGLRIRCGNGWLRIERGQLAGGKPLTGLQLASNRAFAAGVTLGGGKRPPTPGPLIVPVGE